MLSQFGDQTIARSRASFFVTPTTAGWNVLICSCSQTCREDLPVLMHSRATR